MASDIGHFALAISLSIAVIQSIFSSWGAHRKDTAAISFGEQAVLGQLIFVTLAFACMVYAVLDHDFPPAIIIADAHAAIPPLVRISTLWLSDEGAAHLCVLILAFCGAVIVIAGNNLPDTFRARVLAVQGMMGLSLLAFILLKSNPGSRLDPADAALYQPFLYAGYVGSAVIFSFSVAALIEGRINSDWVRWIRPWVISASGLVTIGFVLGKLRPDYTDSTSFGVSAENAALLQCLAGAAFLLSSRIVKHRSNHLNRLILLGLTTFPLSFAISLSMYFSKLLNINSITGTLTLVLLIAATGFCLALHPYRMQISRIRMQIPQYNALWWHMQWRYNLRAKHTVSSAATIVLLLVSLFLFVRNESSEPAYYHLTFVLAMFSLLFFHLTPSLSSHFLARTLRRELTPAMISGIVIVSALAAGSCFGGLTLAVRGFVWDRGFPAFDIAQNVRTAPVPVKTGIST